MNLSSVIYQETVDNIRERVLTMWPDGCIFQTYRDESNEFLVQFSGNPWTAKGSLGSMAMKLILELFAVLARQVSIYPLYINLTNLVCSYSHRDISAYQPLTPDTQYAQTSSVME